MRDTSRVAASVDELIESLNDPSGGGEDAKLELIALGVEIVPDLAARVGKLEPFGKLTAIEAFEALNDQRACSALIGLLADANETVVEWSAGALGSLGCRDAVEPLQRVLAQLTAAKVAPNWTGPATLRRVLADLGARQPVLPSLTSSLQQRHGDTEMPLVRAADLCAVVDDLAEHGQVVLGFTLWRVGEDRHLYGTQGNHAEWKFDWSTTWADNVIAARRAARDAALATAPGLLAHVEWIDEDDVAAGRRGGM